ncbi:MAG TPA: hypothetical protein VFM70_04545 [Salinimicrobium sp.]|nr:hypothetical protein [Salinimicrobium sp.]
MENSTKEYFELLIKELDADAEVTIVDQDTTRKIFDEIEEDIEMYRFENQQKIKDSQEEMANVVFTS